MAPRQSGAPFLMLLRTGTAGSVFLLPAGNFE